MRTKGYQILCIYCHERGDYNQPYKGRKKVNGT